jgi:histidine ammonia-lyase
LTRAKITASGAVVDRALTGGETECGLTTQVGHGKGHPADRGRAPPEQRFLVVSHSGGIRRHGPQVRRSLALCSGQRL